MLQNELIKELEAEGIKHNPEEIIAITRLSSGKIVFLEQGNRRSGLQHILEKHGQDFVNRGIAEDKIVEVIMKAIIEGRMIGTQGATRTIYEVTFEGKVQYLSINIGNNGYIVGVNPTSRKLIQRKNL